MSEELLPCPFCGCTPHTQLGKAWHDQLHGDRHQDTVIKCPRLCVTMSGSPEAVRDRWNTRADLARAQVAAAYEAAAEAAYQWWNDDDAQELRDHIRAIIPADAQAALDDLLKAERAKAYERAAVEISDYQAFTKYAQEPLTNEMCAAIRALAQEDGGCSE